MAEEKEAGLPGRSRLPGFDEDSGRGYRGDYTGGGYGPADHGPYGYAPSGYYQQYPPPAYVRDSGVSANRRTSTWTAAALIAAVAATTGYLAHSIPASTSTSGTTTTGTTGGHTSTTHSGQSGGVQSGAPSVGSPVVTSGGSGAAAGRGGDN
ncbi:MAG TPA: hypothetical protein VFW16_16160 [Streptosporangiaceae bacterium]|nr:hypothetical protein [Streptosporangiaceae bacterium]